MQLSYTPCSDVTNVSLTTNDDLDFTRPLRLIINKRLQGHSSQESLQDKSMRKTLKNGLKSCLKLNKGGDEFEYKIDRGRENKKKVCFKKTISLRDPLVEVYFVTSFKKENMRMNHLSGLNKKKENENVACKCTIF